MSFSRMVKNRICVGKLFFNLQLLPGVTGFRSGRWPPVALLSPLPVVPSGLLSTMTFLPTATMLLLCLRATDTHTALSMFWCHHFSLFIAKGSLLKVLSLFDSISLYPSFSHLSFPLRARESKYWVTLFGEMSFGLMKQK